MIMRLLIRVWVKPHKAEEIFCLVGSQFLVGVSGRAQGDMDIDRGERALLLREEKKKIRNEAVGGGWLRFPFRNRKLLRSTCRRNLSTSMLEQ